jgi:hypothetical protein
MDIKQDYVVLRVNCTWVLKLLVDFYLSPQTKNVII